MKHPKLVGIVNVTPDSFSDGGAAMKAEDALTQIEQLIAEGAEVIDIGAESTRPNAEYISAEVEWQRLNPVLLPVLKRHKESAVQFSVDTRHAETARRALAAGVHWINDVSAAADEALIRHVAAYPHAYYVLMHSLSVPADPAMVLADDADVLEEILQFGKQNITKCEALGLQKSQIIFDVGIGFGKTAKQSMLLVKNMEYFTKLEVPLFVGHSRKSFLQLPPETSLEEKDEKTLAISLYLAEKNVDYLRVHNVDLHKQGLAMWEHMRV